MFCPQCAAPNTDGVKFCRKCGMELEAVALMLRDDSARVIEGSGKRSAAETSQDWLQKRSEAVKEISTGVSLLIVSVLIGLAMAFFVPGHIPWILAWAVLVGWMACWGGIAVGNGVAGVLEAKTRLRLLGMAGNVVEGETMTRPLLSASHPTVAKDTSDSFGSAPSSVTEGTTRKLDDLAEK